jgi:nitrogen regulatory protein PII
MKEVRAIIQPFMLDKVIDGLKSIKIGGLTITEVRGFGQEGPENDADYTMLFTPKVQIQTVVPDEELEGVIETIRKNAFTGRHGAGKIFVYDVEKVVRILTGQVNEEAL